MHKTLTEETATDTENGHSNACDTWHDCNVAMRCLNPPRIIKATRKLRDRFAALAMHAELNTSGWNAESAKALVEAATVAGRTIEAQIAFNAYTLAAAMLEMRRSAYSVINTRKRAEFDAPTPGMVGAPRRDIEALVDRFLSWPLPDSVRSDDCATTQGYPGRTGTTLLTANEARQMLEYVLMPIPIASEDLGMRAGFARY